MKSIDPLSLLTSYLKLVLAPLLQVEYVDASQLRACCDCAAIVAEGNGRELVSSRDRLDVATAADIEELDLSINPATCEEEVIDRGERYTCAAAAWMSIKLRFLWPESM